MSYINELEGKLNKVRRQSIGYREEKKMIERKTEQTKQDRDRLEEIRVEINKCRKEEKFLNGRIKQHNESKYG